VRTSGRAKAYAFIKDTLLADPETQGTFINEQAIADRIGVSRTPIREALLLLAAEDLVQLVPKKGAYIAPLSGREVSELMELRGMVERYAAERTLATGTVPLEEMTAALGEQEALRSENQVAQFIDWDARFHAALVGATDNGMLAKMYEGLRARQVRCGMAAVFRSAGRQDAVLTEHRAILDALAAGDAEAAAKAIDAHLEATRRVLLTS
jgi:DNA-binding GntR family transcriptional regulator